MAKANIASRSKAAIPFLGTLEEARAAGAIRFIDGHACERARGDIRRRLWEAFGEDECDA